jgi:23S rRNA pseudouridine1911/1915/1917 synthase
VSQREFRSISIPEGLNQERVDAALSRLLGISRNVVVNLIESGDVTIAGKSVGKSDRVNFNDQLDILLPATKAPAKLVATPIDGLNVIYNDDFLIVIDKPVGIAAHASPGWQGATVVGAILAAGYQLSTSGAAERQGVVHRLDVGTSGLMVVAKNEIAYANLKDQFRNRSVTKIYHALAQGHLDPTVGTIDAPIDRHPREDYRFAVVANGKPSITHYKTLEVFPAVTLLEIELETGRTHQIRVHLSALHHPLVGDMTYGSDPALAKRLNISRPWLHAKQLGFTHPASGQQLSFTAEYPADLTRSLEILSEISH